MLSQYHDKIGGEPVYEPPPKGKKKGGKRTASEALDSPAPSSSSKKRGRKSDTNGNATTAVANDDVPLPKGSWESEVSHIMSIVEEENDNDNDNNSGASATRSLTGYIQWNSGRKTKHPLVTLRGKCPQALLTYYENHL